MVKVLLVISRGWVKNLKRAILIAMTTLVGSGTSIAADNVQGVVVVGERGCEKRSRIVIDTSKGFTVADVYTGSFDKGDEIFGDLSRYGLRNILVNNRNARVYIEDYGLNKSRAADKCFGG